MLNIRPLSDQTIVIVCASIALISLPFNVYSLRLTCKMWSVSSRRIVVVSAVLQVVYAMHNFHTAVLFVPFLYVRVAGGYCIGILCEPHYVSFDVNFTVHIILTVNLWGLFNLLLLFRHQSLLRDTSPVKLGKYAINVAPVLLMTGINILPVQHVIAIYLSSIADLNRIMEAASYFQCKRCDWIERDRNYGVLERDDATIGAYIVGMTAIFYMTFAVVVTVHICMIINQYAKLRTTGAFTTKITRTKQSLVQVATFGTFVALPAALIMSLEFFEFEDDSVVLIPCIFIYSLTSLSHSSLTIYHSPFTKTQHKITRPQISTERTKKESKPTK